MTNDAHNLPPSLRGEDEALAIENAIKEAINTVMKVICGASDRRALEHQRMVADRDKEIRRLECKLEKSESELKALRLNAGRTQPEDEPLRPVTFRAKCGGAVGSDEPGVDSSDVGAAAPSQISPQRRDAPEAFPHRRAPAETRSRGREGAAGGRPPGCVGAPVKEEPSDLETVIKWEVCEGSFLDRQAGQCGGKPAKQASSNAVRSRRYRERIRADPERLRIYREKERLRKRRKKLGVSEFPKEAQKQQRVARRSATRWRRAYKKSSSCVTETIVT